MTDWTVQRHFEDVVEGEELRPVAFALPVYRLVMAAGANRDFNSIHHNSEYARATGAPEMYANNLFLQGMWERAAREYIGMAGRLRKLRGFRMRTFTVAGETATVHATVQRAWVDDELGLVELKVWTETSTGVTVGPGTIEASLPRRAAG